MQGKKMTPQENPRIGMKRSSYEHPLMQICTSFRAKDLCETESLT